MKKILALSVALGISISAVPLTTVNAADDNAVVAETDSENQYNVLVLNFDPVFEMAGNKRMHELMGGWSDPRKLTETFISDMEEISHGNINYNVAEWIDIDALPESKNHNTLNIEEYYNTLQAALNTEKGYWQYEGWVDDYFSFDYEKYFEEYNIYERVDSGEIDEVFLFSGPCTGATMYETIMVGRDAYWCNGRAINYDCRNFVVSGFNFERGVGEMLEDEGHRMESIMNQVIGRPDYTKDYSDYTDWEKFTAYEEVAPGHAGVGNVHFAPNSEADYDWGNERYVESNCNEWVNYPELTGKMETVNCELWGNGDIRLHHKWWFSNIPHVDTMNEKTGYYNNWWKYYSLDYMNEINPDPEKHYKVLVLNFDPVFEMAENKKMHELVDYWTDPRVLTRRFISDMREISHGNINYDIADWIDIDELPESQNHNTLSIEEYYKTLIGEREGWVIDRFSFDYEKYLEKYNIYERVESGEIDEVFLFSGPYTGAEMHETLMVGRDAYWCNGRAIKYDCRNFVVSGFNFERGVGEMLEDEGHRMESIMNQVIGRPDYTKDYSCYTDWEKFTAYEEVAPGHAGVGNVHFAPNSEADYDWGNKRYVESNCNDWVNYPELTGKMETVSRELWGNGDIRLHHKWWFSNIPHVDTMNEETGYYNNWWRYYSLDYMNKSSYVFGDVNLDGRFSIADAVILQKWLVNAPDAELKDWKAVDLNDDGIVNSADFSLMRYELLRSVFSKKVYYKQDMDEIGYSDELAQLVESGNSAAVITSETELADYLFKITEKRVIGPILDKYDAEFFEDNVLLVNCFINIDEWKKYKVYNVQYENKTLVLNYYDGDFSDETELGGIIEEISVPKISYHADRVEWRKTA